MMNKLIYKDRILYLVPPSYYKYALFQKIIDNITGNKYMCFSIEFQKWSTKKVDTMFYDGFHRVKNYGFISIYKYDFIPKTKEEIEMFK